MDIKVNCPKCRKPMKVHYGHWVDPLLECRTKSCVNAKHLHRKSKVVGDEPKIHNRSL